MLEFFGSGATPATGTGELSIPISLDAGGSHARLGFPHVGGSSMSSIGTIPSTRGLQPPRVRRWNTATAIDGRGRPIIGGFAGAA
ncbi:hypothetical protein [Methylobacterium sp. SyP6R]|uniref:hypothetical protein n=1 Tax=Methylobacterium sp. SyP6R TaxID=2718876 RepID=UPI001F4842C8|nr:hypothetical protein [Methylobacterium sp. SyP6R]MCF4129822.1 hypothetical protein [Methylobacterium sp. SyP6R]